MLTVLTGGDTVYVFSSEETAALQLMVLVGANLDVERFTLTPERWAEVKTELTRKSPEVDIVEVID